MSKAPLALVLAGVLASSSAVVLQASDDKATSLRVSVRVVSSCGVRVGSSGSVDVRCTRGAADRVVLHDAQAQVVTLERTGTSTVGAQVQTSSVQGSSSAERVVTPQF